MEFKNGENYVGRLQEFCVKSPWIGLPLYDDLGSTGQSNAMTFKMACRVGKACVERELKGKKADLKRLLAFEMLQFLLNNNEPQSARREPISTTSAAADWVSPRSALKSPDPVRLLTPTAPEPRTFIRSSSSHAQIEVNRTQVPTTSRHEPMCHEAHLRATTRSPDLTGMSGNVNYAAILIDFCHLKKLEMPIFNVLTKSGPPHNPKFKMECLVSSFSVQLEMESNMQHIRKCLNFLMHNKLQEYFLENGTVNAVPGKELDSGYGSRASSPPNKVKLSQGHESASMASQFTRTLCFDEAEAEVERSRGGVPAPTTSTVHDAKEAAPGTPPASGGHLGDARLNGEFDQFEGMDVTENYAGHLNNYVQKHNLVYSHREVVRSGPPNRPTFTVQVTIARKRDPTQVLHSVELKMEKNIKTIKRYLDFLLWKKLGSTAAGLDEGLVPELVQQAEEERNAQTEELRLVREKINQFMPKRKSSTDTTSWRTRSPSEGKDLCKGNYARLVLNNCRNGITGGKTSRQILSDIIQDEDKYGNASVRDFWLSQKSPFHCMVSLKFHDSSFTFPGKGTSRSEALEDGATKAVQFLDKMLLPKI